MCMCKLNLLNNLLTTGRTSKPRLTNAQTTAFSIGLGRWDSTSSTVSPWTNCTSPTKINQFPCYKLSLNILLYQPTFEKDWQRGVFNFAKKQWAHEFNNSFRNGFLVHLQEIDLVGFTDFLNRFLFLQFMVSPLIYSKMLNKSISYCFVNGFFVKNIAIRVSVQEETSSLCLWIFMQYSNAFFTTIVS